MYWTQRLWDQKWPATVVFLMGVNMLDLWLGTALLQRIVQLLPHWAGVYSTSVIDFWQVFTVGGVWKLLVTLFMLFLMMTALEKRSIISLNLHWNPKSQKHFAVGALVGVGVVVCSYATALALGRGKILKIPSNDLYTYAMQMAWCTLAIVLYVIAEELIVRGYVLQRLESAWGIGRAAFVSAIVYSATLSSIDGYNWKVAVLVFLAGLLLAGSYFSTRTLLMPIGIHLGWAITQAVIVGLPWSGLLLPKLMVSRIFGDKLFTGGRFGLDGGLYVLVGLLLAALALYFWHKRSSVPPSLEPFLS